MEATLVTASATNLSYDTTLRETSTEDGFGCTRPSEVKLAEDLPASRCSEQHIDVNADTSIQRPLTLLLNREETR